MVNGKKRKNRINGWWNGQDEIQSESEDKTGVPSKNRGEHLPWLFNNPEWA